MSVPVFALISCARAWSETWAVLMTVPVPEKKTPGNGRASACAWVPGRSLYRPQYVAEIFSFSFSAEEARSWEVVLLKPFRKLMSVLQHPITRMLL